MNTDGSLYQCHCRGIEGNVENCGVCEGYGLLLSTPRGPVALSQVEPRPLVAMMSVRLASIESMWDQLQKRFWEMETKLQERREGEKSYMADLHDQNRMLRGEVRILARQMGLQPANIEGEPWVPRNARGALGAAPEEENGPLQAVRGMVREYVREATDETAFTPDHVYRYVDDIVGDNIEKLVKSQLGLSVMGRIERGPLKDAIKEALAEIDLVGYAREALKAIDLDAEIPEHLKETAGDEFREELRTKVRQLARDKAEELARESLREVIEQAVLDEMPWLKRYLATKRLGKVADE